MQEQAIRRAREMQQKARITIQEAEVTDIPEPPPQPESIPDEPPEKRVPRKAQPRNRFSGFYSMLQRLPADDDMTVILPIIMMLLKEGADEKLILALLYIMS